MRVTMLCLEWPSENHSGGVARYAFRMASSLCRIVDLSIVTMEGGVDLPGARVTRLRKPKSRFDRYYILPFVARAAVRMQDPELVHSFGDDWLLSRRNVPIVRSFFGSSWSEAKSSSGMRRLNHAVLSLTEKLSQGKSAVRIAIAPETMEVFDCHRLMPPVTETGHIERQASPTPSVVFIGSFNGRKRGWFAEEAVREVSVRLGREVRLTVIGPASDREYWHADTNHVSGASDREVLEIISESWVLVSPSLYEGFGIPIFEALSVGISTVASENPGSSYLGSLCRDSEALLVAKTDPEFVSMLENRITSGPALSDVDLAIAKEAVRYMLELASVSGLVSDVYVPLVQANR